MSSPRAKGLIYSKLSKHISLKSSLISFSFPSLGPPTDLSFRYLHQNPVCICSLPPATRFVYLTLLDLINYMFVKWQEVAQSVEALRYKSEGHGFDSRWCQWNFSLTVAPGSTQSLTEMSTRNISWVKDGRCIGLTSPITCNDCLEIWEPQLPGTLRACPGL